jgi:hypothetical protein
MRVGRWPPLILIHSGGLDGLYALLDLGGFFVPAEGAEGLSLALECGYELEAVLTPLLFQHGEELAVARLGFLRFAPGIVNAAERGQGKQTAAIPAK